jgi:hypothetical protein
MQWKASLPYRQSDIFIVLPLLKRGSTNKVMAVKPLITPVVEGIPPQYA